MVRKPPTDKVIVSPERILRAVASSSAIEKGEPTAVVEKRLKTRPRRFAKLTLAY